MLATGLYAAPSPTAESAVVSPWTSPPQTMKSSPVHTAAGSNRPTRGLGGSSLLSPGASSADSLPGVAGWLPSSAGSVTEVLSIAGTTDRSAPSVLTTRPVACTSPVARPRTDR